jgi:hypothetical protein
MPSPLIVLTATERLAAHVNDLPPEFSRALGEDLEYARFGAALPELPCFGGWKLGLGVWFQVGEPAYFARLFRDRAPVAFGLKAAELVSNGALVGTEAGLAFVAGYFTQLCVVRALEPVAQTLLATHRKQGESEWAARERIGWTQALFLMQELHGAPLVGTPAVRTKLQIRKGNALKGISRGLFELMRVASNEAFGDAPTKTQVDQWMRGLHLYDLALGSPLGKLKTSVSGALGQKDLYRSQGVDAFAAVDHGLARAREALTMLGSMVRRNSFGARARSKFLEVCPEGSPDQFHRATAA